MSPTNPMSSEPTTTNSSSATSVAHEIEQIETLTPSNAVLLRLAERCPPPHEWFRDEEECPFSTPG